MNKNLFRIIFNKRRGQLMVVAETTSSQGKGAIDETVTSGHHATENSATVAINALSFAVLCTLGAVLWASPTPHAHAQVVAYRNAPGSQQPTVLQTANGVPQINIQTPSAAGVSHNIYSQFDVQSNGAILNNSRTNVQTQQGGWVQGNPWLATGSARVILNEVNSSNPSYLNGYVEVAGQKAEVVIANPSGISVNGGGFINTSKATLTTGSPIVNGGSLDGYRIQSGNISIHGNGLDLTTTDYAAILARAVQVNAGIWANELKVVTGANQIDASSLATNTTPVTTTIAGTGSVPTFALDVAQIGGMYAGKIYLIGTEQGLGVRSAGILSTTGGSTGGDLVLQNNGWLTTTGTLQASANLQITTQGNIINSGTLYASNDQTLSATGNVTNSGVIAAQGNTSILANSLNSTSASVVGAGIKTDGTWVGSGNLNIATTQALAVNGQNLAAGNITLTGGNVDLSGSQTGAANIAITANSGNVSTANATVATSGTAGVLAITAQTNNDQTLDNTHGALSAGQLNLNIANLNNAQGQITQTGVGDMSIALTSPTSTFNNTGGTVSVNSANFEIAANALTNTDGKIQHAGTGVLSVSAGVSVAQPSGNTELNNTRGLIQATAGQINLSAGNFDNTQGTVYAHTGLSLVSVGTITNTGFIAAQGNATLSANSLNSSSTSVLGAGVKADGSLANSGNLNITTTQALRANGQNLAAGNATLSGSSVNLSGSQTGAANISITATSDDANTSNATVSTAGTLNITAKANNNQTLNNTQGVLSAGQLHLDVANLNNAQGKITQTGVGDTTIALTSSTSTLNNTGGILATNSANFNLNADTLTNTDGTIQHAGTDTLSMSANVLTNLRGQIVGNQNATLQIASLDNTQGSVYASKDLRVAATGAITNTGFIAAQGNTTLSANSLNSSSTSVLGAGIKADGSLANSGNLNITTTQALRANGQNLAAGNATLSGSSVNLSGSQTGAANISITATSDDANTSNATVSTAGALNITAKANNNQTLNNTQGVLSAGQLHLDVANLNNAQGKITQTGVGDTTIALTSSTSTLNNTGGILATNSANFNLNADTLTNTDGKIQHAGTDTLSMSANALTNLRGQIVGNQNATLQIASLDNTQGSIYASKDLRVAATGVITNTGFIAAQGNTTLSANSLNSSSTSVLGAGIKADGSLANSGNLNITTTQALRANGQNLAAGNATLSGSSVNLSGSQTGAANISITATSGDVNTSGATVATSGTTGLLHIVAQANPNQAQTLNNQQGVLRAGQINLEVAKLDNTQGSVYATKNLTLTATNAVTNTGFIAAQGNTTLSANSLSSSSTSVLGAGIKADGTLANSGDLNITTTQALNTNGQNLAAGNATLSGSSVNLSGSQTSAANIGITATSGDINTANATVTTAGTLSIAAKANNSQTLNNAQGVLSAGQLTVDVANLNNTNGKIQHAGTDTLHVTANTLNNQRGEIGSNNALVMNAGTLSNLQGLVAANGNVTLTTTSVDNNLGTVASHKNLSLTTTSLNNAGGTIAASQAANLQTGTFNNNAGLVQTGSDLTIHTHDQTLTNTNAANYTSSNAALNGKGGIAAQGTTTLTTGDLNNDAGYIGSQGAMTANSANISNQSGQIQALSNLTLTAGNGSSTGTINNTGGLIRSAATTSLSAGSVTNSSTSGTDLGIEGLDVRVSATALHNNSGAIRADRQLTVTSTGTVNNSAGLMSAGNTLTLQDVQAQASRTLAITNTNATLLAGQALAVAANRIGGDGSILSKGNLNLALNTDFANSGQVIANGDMTISTIGNVSNSGKLQAGNTLNLSANNIDNTATGEISANTTRITANNTLTNRGLIDGVNTHINAVTLNNIGTGRIYGDTVSIQATTVLNDAETVNGITTAATIAARTQLDIGVQTLTNTNNALIYSDGDMTIGGSLNANRQAIGSAQTITNNGSTIEATKNLKFNAQNIQNLNRDLAYRVDTVHNPNTSTQYVTDTGRIINPDQTFALYQATSSWAARYHPDHQSTGYLWANSGALYLLNPDSSYNTTAYRNEYNTANVVNYQDSTPQSLNFAAADSVRWQFYGLTPPSAAAPSATRPDLVCNLFDTDSFVPTCSGYTPESIVIQQAWDAAAAPYIELQNKIDALRTAMNAEGLHVNSYASYTADTQVLTVTNSNPGKITSGANMTLNASGNLLNDMSQIISGGTLSITGVNLENRQRTQATTEQRTGKQYLWSYKDWGCGGWHGCDWELTAYWDGAYNATINTTSTLSLAQSVQNQTVSNSYNVASMAGMSTLPSLASTGTATAATGTITTFTIAPPAGTNASTSTASVSLAVTPTSTTTTPTNNGDVTGTAALANTSGVRLPTAPTPTSATVTPTSATVTTTTGSSPIHIRTVTPNTTLPSNSLYHTLPAPSARYLVETDARFTDNKTWLSSDYMTQTLSLDPTVTQKRLGDGFYEQKLIREQVAQLTGKRFLANFRDDEQEYQALMNSAVTFAKTYNLRPGIALSASQVALLTSDIVWLVEKTIPLPDGSTQKALVPQLYVRPQPGDLDSNGSLLSGKDVNINLSGDLTNTGQIAGRNVVNLAANNLNNLGGRIQADDVQLSALQDLNNVGGSISAVNSLSATAGRDLNATSTVQQGGSADGSVSLQRVERVASLYVSGANGQLSLNAGKDLNLTAAQVVNTGTGPTTLKAGNAVNLNTLTESQRLDVVMETNKQYAKTSQSKEVGSTVSGGGNVSVTGKDINARAATLDAVNTLSLNATNNVNIEAGLATQSFSGAIKSASHGGVLGSDSETVTKQVNNSTTAQASNLGGQVVQINAGHDITLKGSNVVSDNETTLTAKNNVTIVAAQNTQTQGFDQKTVEVGFLGGGSGLSVSYGERKQSLDNQSTSTTAAASTVGSINGNANIQAGNAYKQIGSDVVTPNGDVNISAKTVDIQEARETNKQSSEQKFEQSGLTLAINSGLVDNLQGAQKQQQAANQTKDTRMKALAVANEVANVNAAVQDAATLNASVSLGSSSSESKQTSTSDTARGSTVQAAGTVSIKATRTAGASNDTGQDSNLTIQGSDVSGKTVNLEADNKVNLLAAQNTVTQTSTSSNSSASVGASIGTSGLGVTASASMGKGNGNGTDTTYTNTHIAGAENVNIKSGGDTTLKGATVEGKQVTANVGGNLNIESLQDTRTYAETNQQVGGSVMIGMTDKGPVKGNVNYGQSNINSNYASVAEQSALKAGDGGFTVNVQGNTALVGGAITSTQAAIDNNKNSFSTGGTLTTSDIQNKASFDANSVSVTAGTGSTPGQSASAGMSGVGFGTDKGSANSTTTAGISGIAGDTAKRTGDAQQGIKQIFNQTQVKAEIGAQTAITSEFGKNASKAVGDYAQTKLDEAKANKDQAGIDAWSEGGANRVALHTLVGGLTGGAAGAVGAGTASAAAPSLDQLQTQLQQGLQNAGLGESTSKVIASLTAGTTAAGIGAAASGGSVAGGATAFNADMNNRQLSLPERQKLKSMANNDAQKEARLTDAACALAKCSAQYAPSTKEYQDAKAAEMRGANNTQELTELAKVSKDTGLFDYTKLDKATDTVKFTGNVLDKEVVQPIKTAKVPDGSYGVGYYQGLGGEVEVEVQNGSVSAGKVGLGVGAGGHINLGTQAISGAALQGAVSGIKGEALVETNPIQSGEARVGTSVGASVGLGVVSIEGTLGGGTSVTDKGLSGYTNATITPAISPVTPKVSAEIKANLIEFSVKPKSNGVQDAK